MYKLILIIQTLILLTSCQYDPYAHQYTTKEPNESNIVGTYIFENQTVDFGLKSFKDSITGEVVIPMIEIFKDGSYKVKNLPYFKSFSPVFSGLITKEGTWDKTTVGSIGDGSGKTKQHWGVQFNGLPEEVQYLGLMNENPPYSIIFGFGDPDAGTVMIFKKK